jgi:hypothetical protein
LRYAARGNESAARRLEAHFCRICLAGLMRRLGSSHLLYRTQAPSLLHRTAADKVFLLLLNTRDTHVLSI